MKYTEAKLREIQKEIEQVLNDAKAGKLTPKTAADKIVHLREEMTQIIEHLADVSKN